MQNSIQNKRRRPFWILVVIAISAAIVSGWEPKGSLARQISAVQPQERDRLSVDDSRPVASAIRVLETKFGRVITYEDPRWVNPDDLVDVTESVRRDLHQYAPGKAPRVFVPRISEFSVEFSRSDPVEVVLREVLTQSEHVTSSATFRIEETNGIIHVVPSAIKGATGETVLIRSLLETPVQLPAQERNGMQMLEAWVDAVSANSKQQIIVGSAPLNLFLASKDDKGLTSANARDALTEILMRFGKGRKLSWQLFYDPGQKVYAINIHLVQ
jgi:hypothetical protein